MTSGRVIFTGALDYEAKRIRDLSAGYERKFYIYMQGENLRPSLPDFVFIPFKKSRSPLYIPMFTGNSPKDFFVLKNIRFSEIMDRDVEMYQTMLRGYKLIIDCHPFMSRAEVYWSYFPWSFFDKSLLGYPHCYAFRDAKPPTGVDPYDCRILAQKVAPATETTFETVFSGIKTERVALDITTHKEYQDLKKHLFDIKTGPFEIIRELKNFVNLKEPRLKKGFKMVALNKVYGQYSTGERTLFVSNSKVDLYLESQFWKYVNNVNIFMNTLWNLSHA